MRSLYEPHTLLVGKVMDMQLQRQNVIMGNIANINTPKYKPRELAFEEELQKALNLDAQGTVTRTAKEHMPTVFDSSKFGPEWEKKFTPRDVHGEDRVNLDKEMAKLNKNNLQYTTLAQITKSGFDGVKNIISEGSR